jgi:hypothetical protein
MNYKIILDEDELFRFVRWLPELIEGECYYLTLFARKKYHASAKNDKSQCKRVTATSKDWVIKKIRQLELPDGTYTNKDGSPVNADSLALYVTVNPRSFALAQRLLLKKLADTVADNGCNMNPASMAMSAIQKAKSRTVYVDFDFDDMHYEEFLHMPKMLNHESYSILDTRSGFHLLVDPSRVEDRFKRTWHRSLTSISQCDVTGDNLIPVAGCTQGGFMPRLLATKNN